MKLTYIVHEAEEGGFWAEVPAIPGCVTQGESLDEIQANIQEAIEACLSVEFDALEVTDKDQVLEIAL